VFKVFAFAHRSPRSRELSLESYIDLCETQQVLVERRLFEERGFPPYVEHRRNYILRENTSASGADLQVKFDLLIEATFQDRRRFEDTQRALHDVAASRGRRGEDSGVDPGSLRYLFVDERSGGIPLTAAPATQPFKVFMFVRRRPDLIHLSYEEFINSYELERVPLARQMVEEGVLPEYVDQRRNYVRHDEPSRPLTPRYEDCKFDLVLEATYVDRETYESIGRMTQGTAKKALYEDNRPPFDLVGRQYLYVKERSTASYAPR
jgi:hypothetical protein